MQLLPCYRPYLRFNGENLKRKIIEQLSSIKNQVNTPKSTPTLAIVQTKSTPESNSYLNQIEKVMKEVDIKIKLVKMLNPTQTQVLDAIAKLNTDWSVHGMMLMNPLASNLSSEILTNAILPTKDVDCHTDFNLRILSNHLQNSPLMPSVCKTVFYVLDEHKFKCNSKFVVVANDNRRIGRPLYELFRARHAHVRNFGIHNSQGLEQAAAMADFFVTATGQQQMFKSVKSDAVVVDFGCSRSSNGQFVGDVHEPSIRNCKFYTPPRNGIGPITTSMLAFNLLVCWMRRPLILY